MFLKNNAYICRLKSFEKDMKQKFTYSEIKNLIQEHKRLVSIGKREKQPIRFGFTPEEEVMFKNGINARDYVMPANSENYERSRFISFGKAYA